MREMSLSGFMAHIAGAMVEIEHATHRALERAAVTVEREAKREIGRYQDQAGPFQAWKELAEATQAQRFLAGYPENEPLLVTGELRDSISHAVGHHEAVVGSNSEIAEYQELGTKRIPPRSFLGGAAFRKAERVAEILGGGVAMALVGEEVVNKALPISRD
jgi:phage gpG-like protein